MKILWDKLNIEQVAAIISGYLSKNHLDVVLVGGACVSIYSKNEYQSYDLDFVTESTLKELEQTLKNIGFKKISGRIFGRDDCKFVLDFVQPPIAIGNEPVKTVNIINSKNGRLCLITPTDCVKDRLAAYYHWNDPQSLEQALMVTKSQFSKINFKNIEQWSKSENMHKKYKIFIKKAVKSDLKNKNL